MSGRGHRSLGDKVRLFTKPYVRALSASVIISVGGAVLHVRVVIFVIILVAGVILVAALVLIAYAVATYTRSQKRLTDEGRGHARTVKDFIDLKRSEANAFTQFFGAIIHGRQAWLIHRDGGSPWPSAEHELPQILSCPESGPTAISGSAQSRPSTRAADQVAEAHTGRYSLRAEVTRSPYPRRRRFLPDVQETGNGPASAATAGTRPVHSFWQSLTGSQRDALARRGQRKTFAPGNPICRQGELADHLIIIMSGRARVFVEDAAARRLIAERGPGDLIGERAALRVHRRSATVIAVEPVRALIVPTQDSAEFLAAHPETLELVEQLIYERLTESHGYSGPTESSSAWFGQNCSILFTDIAAFTSDARNDHDRQAVRRVLYSILIAAFEGAGIPWLGCHHEDRGDGVFIVVPPEIPTSWIVERILAHLITALKRHNRAANNATRIQLRVALNVGPVISDEAGVIGQAVNQAARMLEVPELKKQLAETGADLALIVSEFVFENVIKHSCEPADWTTYQRVVFGEAESAISSWTLFE